MKYIVQHLKSERAVFDLMGVNPTDCRILERRGTSGGIYYVEVAVVAGSPKANELCKLLNAGAKAT